MRGVRGAALAPTLALAAAASLAAAPGSARAVEPIEVTLERARADPAAAGARVRALEARTERRAARLGLVPAAPRPLPAAPEEIAYRTRALDHVAAFLDARREIARPRIRRAATPRPRGASTRLDAVLHSARLGLTRPAAIRRAGAAPAAVAGRQRWRDVARWLSRRDEAPRATEELLAAPVGGPMTSPFGARWGRMHEGLDIAGASGTPVRAAASGVVVAAGWHGGYGRYVRVRHPDGMRTAYAHLSSVAVAPGRPVSRGDVLGGMGTTGSSTGVHLHFEVHVDGRPVDPRPYLAAGALTRAGRAPR